MNIWMYVILIMTVFILVTIQLSVSEYDSVEAWKDYLIISF